MPQINSDFSWIGDDLCDSVYQVAVEAIEEVVINALLAAKGISTLKSAGQQCAAIDVEALVDIQDQHGRLTASRR